MKIGDVVTFVGAPDQLMAVTSSWMNGDQKMFNCVWLLNGGGVHGTPFPEACLRPVEEKASRRTSPRKFEDFADWLASGEAGSLLQVTMLAKSLGARSRHG